MTHSPGGFSPCRCSRGERRVGAAGFGPFRDGVRSAPMFPGPCRRNGAPYSCRWRNPKPAVEGLLFFLFFFTFYDMEKWTDKSIKRYIDELIEASYLLTLTEPEIKDYLRNFVKSCEDVLDTYAGSQNDLRLTKVKITLLRSYLVLHSRRAGARSRENGAGNPSRIEFLAKHVVQIKNTIMKLMDIINPKLSEAVLAEFRRRNHPGARSGDGDVSRKRLLAEAGYLVLLLLAVILLLTVIFY